MRFPSYLPAAFLVLAAWCPLHANAQSNPSDAEIERASRLFAKADAYEDARDFRNALEAFEQTAQIAMTPGIRYHIAFCQEHLGKLLDAARNYATAQREAKASKSPAAKSVLAVVDQRFTDVAGRIPHVTLKLHPALERQQVKVLVDMQPANLQPSGTFELDPGEHNITVIASGFSPTQLHIVIAEKELREVKVTLNPIAKVAASERNLPTSTVTPPASGVRVGALISTAGATIAAGFGVAAYVLAGSAQEDGKTACASSLTGCDDLKGTVRTWDALALGAWIGAATLGVTATFLWLKPNGNAGTNRATHVSIAAGRVAVGYSF